MVIAVVTSQQEMTMTKSYRTRYVTYRRDDSGIIERTGNYVRLTSAEAVAEFVSRESLRGWPETSVRWQRATGSAYGIARA